jgi:hypothetical protein
MLILYCCAVCQYVEFGGAPSLSTVIIGMVRGKGNTLPYYAEADDYMGPIQM